MRDAFLYFAYGSNMCTGRLRRRAPSARPIGTGYVTGRRLTFEKVSRDGSGKCDACAGSPGDRVFGVLFEISLAEKPTLDRAEGLGAGYAEETVSVVTASGPVEASTYIATARDPAVRPYHWYKRYVLAGATEHALPADYVARIEAVSSVEDPDAARNAENALVE